MNCEECGSEILSGICSNCGLIDDNYQEYDFGDTYPYDKDNTSFSYGTARSHAVSDISVMTRVNKAECKNPNLRRALQWDKNYGWDVQKTEIVNREMRRICDGFGLDFDFLNECYYLFRKIKDRTKLTGKKLEDIAVSIVYLLIRTKSLHYTLFEFERAGYNIQKIRRIYIFLADLLNMRKMIKQQDPDIFLVKFVNSIILEEMVTDEIDFQKKRKILLITKQLFKGIFWRKPPVDLLDITCGEYADPKSMGACLYIANKYYPFIKLTQSQISDIVGCSEVTLRERIDQIKKRIKIMRT